MTPAHGHGHGHAHAFDSAAAAALLEMEGELSAGVVDQAIAVCAGLLDEAGVAVRRVVDLGCGPGVGTAQLARAFPSASVVAADGSPAMLERAGARATRLGLAGRVEARRIDLDGDLADLGRCDLAWAAMALHHAADEAATLRRIAALVEPHGLVCLLERAGPMSVRLAGDLGRPGVWERLDAARAAWFATVRHRMPGAQDAGAHLSMLAAAGLRPVVDRTVTGTDDVPPDAATHRFVAKELERTLRDLAGIADEADLHALRAVVERTPAFPGGRWDGATVTSGRRLLIARPAAG